MRYILLVVVRSGAVLVLALLFAPMANGQQSSGPPPVRGGHTDTLQLELRRQYEREMLERTLATPPAHSRRSQGISLAEFQTNFLKLQVVNDPLLKSVLAGEPLNLKFIAKSAAEIRKIGQRLKANPALPKSLEGVQPRQANIAQKREELRPLLSTLDQFISDFVSNPVFENAKVIDAELSTKALCDLEQIIALSGAIKTSSNKLRQATAKSVE